MRMSSSKSNFTCIVPSLAVHVTLRITKLMVDIDKSVGSRSRSISKPVLMSIIPDGNRVHVKLSLPHTLRQFGRLGDELCR